MLAVNSKGERGYFCHVKELQYQAKPDGQGEFRYIANPQPLTPDTGEAPVPDPRLHGTSKSPQPPVSSGPNPRKGH